MITEKPWGHERIVSKTTDYVVKELCIKANSSTPFIYHSVKGVTLFLMDGKGYVEQKYDNIEEIKVYAETRLLPKSFPFHINVGQVHKLYTEDKGCMILEVSSSDLNDIVEVSE
jgi:hypothetical protein